MSLLAVQAKSDIGLFALPGIPMVRAGDDLLAIVERGIEEAGLGVETGDTFVLAQKIVSKSENRIVDLATVTPSPRALELAKETAKDPRIVELILRESRRVLKARPGLIIVEHRSGLVMANAGIDQSNVAKADGRELALLLPEDPDRSAADLRARLEARFDRRVAIVINDSFGRPWRRGTVGVAIGASGLPAIIDKRGEPDLFGRTLQSTEIGYADEIASMASLLMGQADEARPIVLIRGLAPQAKSVPAAELIRPGAEDLFR